ncbi:MAG: DNA primase [Clostridiales bacterium]|nr:DNA primase [Clostridiales bacterium]
MEENNVDFSQFVEKVLSRVDIVNVISRYLPLNKKGKTFWGCCPFHHEKTPSFAVNEERQFYHCFGCKESGNAITFVQKSESIDFMDALKIVAEMAKMEVPKFRRSDNNKPALNKEKKQTLLSLLRDAGRHYHENLSSDKASVAREYIEHRGLDAKIVTRFGLGYSQNGEEMINYLTAKGYSLADIKEAGIAEIKGDRYYDVFYNRLIIPIINNFGEIVGFGGRLLDKQSHIPVKYRNTSATPVFDKSKIIFGINLLKKKKQKENIKYVIMTEGYMDVMSLHQAGFDTAVASMGTALTQQQARAIKNYTTNVYISYDGDSAGQKATMRGLDILAECGLNIKVVSLPEGMDPDDVIKKYGREGYLKLLKTADTLPAFKIKVLKNDFDLNTPDGKSKFTVEALKVVAKMENPVEKEEYLKVIHDITGYSMDALRQQIGLSERKIEEKRAEDVKVMAEEAEKKTETFDEAELFIVASWVFGKPFISLNDDVYTYLTVNTLADVYNFAVEKIKLGQKVNPSVLYNVTNGDVSKIINYQFKVGDGEAKYKACLAKIKSKYLLKEKIRLADEYSATKNSLLIVQMGKIDQQLKELKYGGADEF